MQIYMFILVSRTNITAQQFYLVFLTNDWKKGEVNLVK